MDVRLLMQFEARKTSVGVAYLLWLFLGPLGAHRFYTGRPLSGLAMFIVLVLTLGTAGAPLAILVVWYIVDAFLIPGWVRNGNLALMNQLAPAPPRAKVPLRWGKGDTKTAAFTAGALAAAIGLILFLAPKSQESSIKSQATTASIENTPSETAPGTTQYFAAPSLKMPNATVLGELPQPPDQPQAWSATVAKQETPPAEPSFDERSASIYVPTDLKATYEVESISKTSAGLVRIVSLRSGPSGTSYSHRECNCGKQTFRYLGDGNTLTEMKARKPDSTFTKLVVGADGLGSISYHVCDHACTAIKRKKASHRP